MVIQIFFCIAFALHTIQANVNHTLNFLNKPVMPIFMTIENTIIVIFLLGFLGLSVAPIYQIISITLSQSTVWLQCICDLDVGSLRLLENIIITIIIVIIIIIIIERHRPLSPSPSYFMHISGSFSPCYDEFMSMERFI